MNKIFFEKNQNGQGSRAVGILDVERQNIFVIRQLFNGDWNFKVENLKQVSQVAEVTIEAEDTELFSTFKNFLTELAQINSPDLHHIQQFGKNYLPFIKENCIIICNQENQENFRNRTIIYNHKNCINIASFYGQSEDMSINTSRGPYKAILPKIKHFWNKISTLPNAKPTQNIYQSAVNFLQQNEKTL